MPSYLIVDWAGENYSDVLSAAKVAAQDGIDVGKTIQVQNGQEIWTGEIASIHASQSKAEKAYRERFPKASSTPAADGKRQRKKKSFGDDFEDDAAAEKINEEQSEASEKKMAQSEKEPSEKEPSEKEKTKTGKMKVKADKEKAKANKEKEKAEKEKARAEKEKEKEAKQKEREEREKKKQEEEDTLKNKENLYMEQIDAIENEKSVDFETSSSPFNCIIEENFSSDSDGLPDNFLANVQKLAGHSPIINSPIINSPFNKSPPSAVLSPVLSPKKPKHPNKGGKAPRAEFTEKKLTTTPSKTQRPNKGGKFPRSLPSLSPRPRLSPRQPFKPAGANKQQPYRYAIKKSCNGCAEKSKIINDQTATIKALEEENDRLQKTINDGFHLDTYEPKSGKLAPKVAEKYMMTQLHQKCPNVYLTQIDFSVLKTKSQPSKAALFLIDCFYKKTEQLEMTWMGSKKKRGVDEDFRNAILIYCRETFKDTSVAISDAALNTAMRSKFTSLQCREKSAKKKLSFPEEQ